ncbi:hypothetical protein [Streptomyces lavendofoliae]|uniref:Uncharacterized protein n=1 Tax=Streptomyces lavendofoliae TaxID=67314 RepID=A0A918M7Y7_9ACTN|nr:hypothetical protein [Streptomyces lavendofoliae]GGU62745.1 hypothetical protein GCM10010274_59460 [Streptomyces lavendofoliae]
MDVAATSSEYLHITVTATLAGDPLTLTTPPQIAIIPGSTNPAEDDWHTGTWADGHARIRLGPGGITLTPGTYWTWIRFAAGSEQPVHRAGRIRIY